MNRRARELELRDTHYTNPIGLDAPGNYSSAYDLARLADQAAQALLRPQDRRPPLGDALDRPAAARRWRTATRCSARTRPSTASRPATPRRRATSSWARARKKGITLVSVVLGTDSFAARDRDSLALLRWGADKYRRIRPGARGHRGRRGARDPLSARRRAPAGDGAEQAHGAARRRADHHRGHRRPRDRRRPRVARGRSSACARSSPTAS